MKISNNFNIETVTYKPSFKRAWQEHISWGATYFKNSNKSNFKMFTFTDAKMVFVEVAKNANKNFGNIKNRIINILASQGKNFNINSIFAKNDESIIYQMTNKGEGVYEAFNIDTEENSQYRFIIVNKNNKISVVKDPYAKKQSDINGWSEIYNSENYEWKAKTWLENKDPKRIIRKPDEPLRGLENLIIEEINIPTLSKEGTFVKAKDHIDNIIQKGIATAIEIMPVENTYSLQWGYDGVDKFAINERMGTSKELKELIDYAHQKGLNVIMDMVPNHIGPDGNFLSQTGPYVKKAGPFGDVPNYEGKDNRYVRDWMVNSALWWINEFKVDGLRLDMTKFCESDYLLKQIVDEVNEHFPEVFLIAEDGRENKDTVTKYDYIKGNHSKKLEMIDDSVNKIANKEWFTYPNAIGFDSEWDFPFMHELKDSLLEPYKINLDRLDSTIWNSKYRVKYLMSHDEIGNLDGTRLIPKIIASELKLFDKIQGKNDSDRGQKAAHLGQKITELYFNNDLTAKRILEFKNKGLVNFEGINLAGIARAFDIAFAKQKLGFTTVMTIPGPKMYFQGDNSFELAYFKFFREFSNDKEKRIRNHSYVNSIIAEKGYDTLEAVARADSIINKNKTDNKYKNYMELFCENLASIVKSNRGLLNGTLISTYKDINNKVHTHHLKSANEEYLIIKNFGEKFHYKNFSINNFPDGKWQEIFNSDNVNYGGSGYVNNEMITRMVQNISLAPNSISIIKKL